LTYDACIFELHIDPTTTTTTNSLNRQTTNMVLEDATRPDEPIESFPSDTPPSNDVDKYGDSNPPYTATRQPTYASVAKDGAQSNIFINVAELPKPFLMSNSPHPPFLIDSIQDSCRFAQQVLKRPCTQDEANAFAYHAAKTYRVASFGSPIGIALGSLQHFRGRKEYRFPGYSPFKEGSYFSKDRLGPLRDAWARAGWQTLRLGSYWMLGSVVGAMFFGSYAVSLSLAGRAMDPRLKDFTEALKQLQKDGVSTQAIRRQQDVNGTTQEETFEQRKQRFGVQARSREGMQNQAQNRGPAQAQAQSSSTQSWDDASPTGGAFSGDYADASSDTGILDDAQMIQQQTRQQADARSTSAENRASTFDLNKAAPQRPSAGRQAANQGEGAAEAPQQSGSTWERLRQQAATRSGPSAGGPRAARGQASSDEDSFSFSQGDEDRQLAKAEAQKEFDARLERERASKDFQGNGGKRW
jgi:hypothetical protein